MTGAAAGESWRDEPDEPTPVVRRELALIPAVEEVSAEHDFHLRAMVDSMLRAGHSEREVVAAVEQATGRYTTSGRSRNGLFGALRRLTG
jgi:hypothetical protein